MEPPDPTFMLLPGPNLTAVFLPECGKKKREKEWGCITLQRQTMQPKRKPWYWGLNFDFSNHAIPKIPYLLFQCFVLCFVLFSFKKLKQKSMYMFYKIEILCFLLWILHLLLSNSKDMPLFFCSGSSLLPKGYNHSVLCLWISSLWIINL